VSELLPWGRDRRVMALSASRPGGSANGSQRSLALESVAFSVRRNSLAYRFSLRTAPCPALRATLPNAPPRSSTSGNIRSGAIMPHRAARGLADPTVDEGQECDC
jgi:hypothetical protein